MIRPFIKLRELRTQMLEYGRVALPPFLYLSNAVILVVSKL